MTRTFTIIFVLAFLISCDCIRGVSGTVKDKTTGKPVNLAQVTILQRNYTTKTDSLGRFHISITKWALHSYCKPKDIIAISAPFHLTDSFSAKNKLRWLKADSNKLKASEQF